MGSAKFTNKRMCRAERPRHTSSSPPFVLVQERVFKEFYSYTFPSEHMSYQAFLEAMDNKLSPTEKTKIQAYFRAFDAQQKSYLTYSDYLLGESSPSNRRMHALFSDRSRRHGSRHFSWRYPRKSISWMIASTF